MSDDEAKPKLNAMQILKKLCRDDGIKEDLCAVKVIPTVDTDADGDPKRRSTKKIVFALYKEVWSTGLKKTLECLLRDKIKSVLAPKVSFADKIPTSKSVLIKRIHEEILKKDGREFFNEISKSGLKILMEDLEMDIPSSKDEYVDALLDKIESVGLENLFSMFPGNKLTLMVEACGLDVASTSKDVMIECLLYQEDFKPSKKKTKVEKASKKKPKIKQGITKVDLHTHYYRDELYEYCRDHELSTTGNKRDYINRILAYVEGRDQPKINKKGAMLNKSKRKKRKESTETDEKKSQSQSQSKKKKSKSDKSEKSEKSKTEDHETGEERGGESTAEGSEEGGKKKKKDNKENKGKEKEEDRNTTTTTSKSKEK